MPPPIDQTSSQIDQSYYVLFPFETTKDNIANTVFVHNCNAFVAFKGISDVNLLPNI